MIFSFLGKKKVTNDGIADKKCLFGQSKVMTLFFQQVALEMSFCLTLQIVGIGGWELLMYVMKVYSMLGAQ